MFAVFQILHLFVVDGGGEGGEGDDGEGQGERIERGERQMVGGKTDRQLGGEERQ